MIEHHSADINRIRMHYVTAGDPASTGEPMLFLHGFPEYWRVWRTQIDSFAETHRVVAPDLRGSNLTERPEEVAQYHISHLVGDVLGLLDHLGFARVTLVAQDWGALLGWSFLLRYPERVARYVTINITHPAIFNHLLRTDPIQQGASQYMLAFRSGGEDMIAADDYAFAEQALFGLARTHGAEISPALESEWWQLLKDRNHLRAGLNYYRAAEIGPPDGQGGAGGSNLIADLEPAALKVSTPVLVLWGQEDPFLLEKGIDGLDQYVSNLTVARIAGASHWVTLEKPALVTEHIRKFIAAS